MGEMARACAAVFPRSSDASVVSIKAEGGDVYMRSYFSGVWVEVRSCAQVDEAGFCSVSALDLSRVATGSVSLEFDGAIASINSRGRFDLPASTYVPPSAPALSGGVEVFGGVEALHMCAPFCDESSPSTACHGVGFTSGRAVGGNGVSFASVEVGGEVSGQVVPKSAVGAIPKSGKLILSGDAWSVEMGGVLVSGSLIDAIYPSIDKAISEGASMGKLDAPNFSALIDSASVGRAHDVVADFGSGVISPSKFRGAHVEASVPFEVEGGRGSAVFSVAQVKRALSFLGGDAEVFCNGTFFRFSCGPRVAFVGMMRDDRNDIPE